MCTTGDRSRYHAMIKRLYGESGKFLSYQGADSQIIE